MTFDWEEFETPFDHALAQAYTDGWQAGYIYAYETMKQFAVNNIQYVKTNEHPAMRNIANLEVDKYKEG